MLNIQPGGSGGPRGQAGGARGGARRADGRHRRAQDWDDELGVSVSWATAAPSQPRRVGGGYEVRGASLPFPRERADSPSPPGPEPTDPPGPGP